MTWLQLKKPFVVMLTSYFVILQGCTYSAQYCNRGLAKYEQGDLDGAIADYNKAIKSDPKNPIAYFNRGLAKQDKGDFDDAIEDYSKAVEIDPKYAGAYFNRGISWESKKDYSLAIKDFKKAAELDSQFKKRAEERIKVCESHEKEERVKRMLFHSA